MRGVFDRVHDMAVAFGIDTRKTVRAMRGLPSYLQDLRELRAQRRNARFAFRLGRAYPCLEDRHAAGGTAKGHYFHQDLLVARRIHANQPQRHLDVGSRVDGFVAHVASFRKIVVLDIRPTTALIPNVEFVQADLMHPPDAALVGSCDSLSCLHALEHFGLGRYGDPVNYDGYLTGLDNLHLLLRKGGKFYFSVPIGPQRIEFNAHRVFSVSHLIECFAGRFRIDHFSFVDDPGALHENVILSDGEAQRSFGCYYGCGIFEMTKL